jgi:hypothetical protein
VIRYLPEKNEGEKQNREMKIQCTATRSRETDWVLVFKDADTVAKTK